jgi:hypothetical protein
MFFEAWFDRKPNIYRHAPRFLNFLMTSETTRIVATLTKSDVKNDEGLCHNPRQISIRANRRCGSITFSPWSNPDVRERIAFKFVLKSDIKIAFPLIGRLLNHMLKAHKISCEGQH